MQGDELPLKEWIVIFYPQTGAARLCPTLDFAQNAVTSMSMFYKHVYKSAKDFQVRHDHSQLETCWRKLHETTRWKLPKSAVGDLEDYDPTPPDVSTETFSRLLWDFIQDVGDRLSTPRMDNTGKTKENYELRLNEMARLASNDKDFEDKYNKQARTVFTALLENGRQFLTEDEIKKIILLLVADRKLKTRQKPWVIFQYYRPQFIKDGYVIRGRERKSKA